MQVTPQQREALVTDSAILLDYLLGQIPGTEKDAIIADIAATVRQVDTTTPADAGDAISAASRVFQTAADISGNEKLELVADIVNNVARVINHEEGILPAAVDIWKDVRHLRQLPPAKELGYGQFAHTPSASDDVKDNG